MCKAIHSAMPPPLGTVRLSELDGWESVTCCWVFQFCGLLLEVSSEIGAGAVLPACRVTLGSAPVSPCSNFFHQASAGSSLKAWEFAAVMAS